MYRRWQCRSGAELLQGKHLLADVVMSWGDPANRIQSLLNVIIYSCVYLYVCVTLSLVPCAVCIECVFETRITATYFWIILVTNRQTWIQDLLLQDQDQDQDSEVPRLRPRPRLSSFKTKTKTKTLMSKTKTETQDLQDQHWKFMTGMDCDKQKDWKVKSHGKQKIQHTGSCTQ